MWEVRSYARIDTHVRGSGFPRPVTAGLETMRSSQLQGSHYEITRVTVL